MKLNRIKTHFLRYLVFYFGHLGLQLVTVSRSHPRSILNFAFNLAINFTTVYGLSRLDILSFDHFASTFQNQKPIYATFLKICLDYLLPGAFIATKTFYFLHGGELVVEMDAACFRRVYSTVKMRRMFWFALVGSNVYYIGMNFGGFAQIFTESNEKLKDLISYLSQYVIAFTHYFPCVTLHYLEYGLLKSLVKIERSLTGSSSKGSQNIERDAIRDIQQLAQASERLGHLMSFPMFVFFAMRIINGISVFCLAMLQVKSDILLFLVPSCLTWLYVLYLVYLNQLVKHAFGRVCTALRNRPSELEYPKGRALTKRHYHPLAVGSSQHPYTSSTTSQIHLHCIEHYRDHFEIPLFSLARIDPSLLLSIGMFMLNYVVFLYQTN